VHSATEGIVTHVGENNLGGKVVFILGAGGRTYYYAHLDRHEEDLNAGDLVTTNTVIGYVGNTGNARATPPHLHFAIFGTDGAINPLPLLRDREVGAKAREET
jgi:murein DD-endopeptidase MepM/ murein hydrolase activator NlpD